ncbi:CLUMA_CG004931, isoform A [Clunio marinus]|uniref:RCR-type E3 ubiquitin transferase n=1 Tax=Clunio marinus TaxID=568069 RepID=A0A1J1HTD2_9DIPT|nr:CLUMA_CG004931, isoform A [Clunio marinus]
MLFISEQSHEKQFLKDFVFLAPDSAGARLASWIQPESRLDPNRCELKFFQDPIQSGWPTKLVIETRDQYGEIVYVPNMRIQLKLVHSSNFSIDKRYNKIPSDHHYFIPLSKVNYMPVIKEKEKICIKSITAMKAYSQCSFEELRLHTPIQNKTSNLITAKDYGDHSYSILWTPEAPGNYTINIIIDGVQVNENYNVNVINANIPPPIKGNAIKKIQPQYKYRRYYAEYTSGLRIRLHPTLQADQIGVIKINDVVSFIEEIENGDGLWVKLSTDAIRKYCASSWYPMEAWCLAYNKHFDKRLLFALIEPNGEMEVNQTDDMNNVKLFQENFSGDFERLNVLKEEQINIYTDTSKISDDEKPPKFEDIVESQVEQTNQSNLTAAIAGVVEGGAHKFQAFQKWLKRDSIEETTATIRKRIGSIPEVYNNNTLDLKNLASDDISDKLSNDIKLSPSMQDSIIAPNKLNKVNVSEVHDQKHSNSVESPREANKNQEIYHCGEEAGSPKQALSATVAETIRAIFAAFLWHEGLVHDAIACASFLKFHPAIPKKSVYEWSDKPLEETRELLTKDEKIQQRHSVEIINTSNYLNARPSTLEALTKSGYCCVHYRRQRGKLNEHSMYKSNDDFCTNVCPPALKCLVFVWDGLNVDFQNFLNKMMMEREQKDWLPSKVSGNDSNETETPKCKVNLKKLISDENAAAQGAVGGVNDDVVWCELCDTEVNFGIHQQNTFTQHLKMNHPGCGGPTKGKGYNASGVYCEGWVGHCGEEGVGATSWYLMCESCRDKYMPSSEKQVNETLFNRPSIVQKRILTTHSTNNSSQSFFSKNIKLDSNMTAEFVDTMKDNALFLLDLNSCNGGLLNKANSNNLMSIKSKMRGNLMQANPMNRFSTTDEHSRRVYNQKQNSSPNCYGKKGREQSIESTLPDLLWTPPENITCLDVLNAKVSESESCNIFNQDPFIQQNQNNENKSNEIKFHRSFSMIQGWSFYSHNISESDLTNHHCNDEANLSYQNEGGTRGGNVVMRRKKNCLCDSSTDASLLNFPSTNLKKLVPEHIRNPKLKTFIEVPSSQAIDRDAVEAFDTSKKNPENMFLDFLQQNQQGQDDFSKNSFLNRPAIKFIFARHEIDKLRHLLRRNLRKAVCSVFGIQALNWLLRTVSQTMCVHDIMWWFLSSLTRSKNESVMSSNLDESDFSYEHPVAISNIDDYIQNLLLNNLHQLLQSIADITLSLPSGSPLQRLAIQCFCIKFRPNDHQFLHNSHVFNNISKILSKSEEFNEENLTFSTVLIESQDNRSRKSSIKVPKDKVIVYNNVDITDVFELNISSRQAMACALTDNSTETFWESDDEDRNKPKIIEISMIRPHYVCKSINIHIDNCRDLAVSSAGFCFEIMINFLFDFTYFTLQQQHKVTSFTVYSGTSLGELNFLESVETESNIGSWYSVLIKDETNTHFRVELRGVENNIRIRQIKLLGYSNEKKINQESVAGSYGITQTNTFQIQQKYCELETLRVFRVLTNQVFGKLIINTEGGHLNSNNFGVGITDSHLESPVDDSLDLREHMVGILFSRSKLTNLQKQIIVHIVHSIQKEAQKSREEWELQLSTISSSNALKGVSSSEVVLPKSNDVYCFEMLSMVLALSGSSVGRSYLSHQIDLIQDLLTLLHTGSERVQRQVALLLRRILPEISPEGLCSILKIQYQPHSDINSLLQNPKFLNPLNVGILDFLLAIIAKSLQIQVKFKNGSNPLNNKNLNVKLEDYIVPPFVSQPSSLITQKIAPTYQHQISSGTDGDGSVVSHSSHGYYESTEKNVFREDLKTRWFLCGSSSTKLAENIICLIKDMMNGKLSDKWTNVTKTAVAECIVNLTHLDDAHRQPEACLKTPTMWLALASLCVLDEEHVMKLSSSQWSKSGINKRPLCINHDDSITTAVIECVECGTLCFDCDRFLHLNRKTWNHNRTVCKEEEESIKVELHESCGRIKLFWLLGLADSRTLKGIIEFRDGHNIIVCDPQNATGRCRFCGIYGNAGLLSVGNVCVEQQCQEHSANACSKILQCGHFCGGIRNEANCLPCLHQKCQSTSNFISKNPKLTQDGDDMCMICFTEALSCAPSIQMICGHVFHYHCSKLILQKRWHGAKISFAFSQCPICKNDIYHESLTDLLQPINALKDDVRRKAVMRLKFEGIEKETMADQKDLSTYAMERYAYYVCCKCQKAYYGGEARCDVEMAENFNPEELVCGGCSDIAKAQMCPKHGMDFLEYKCRYCCSVAVFFCFGTTHFCDTCHDDFQRLTNIPKIKLPKCPAGPKAMQLMTDECPLHIVHPPTGEEFALGCGICRNFHTF